MELTATKASSSIHIMLPQDGTKSSRIDVKAYESMETLITRRAGLDDKHSRRCIGNTVSQLYTHRSIHWFWYWFMVLDHLCAAYGSTALHWILDLYLSSYFLRLSSSLTISLPPSLVCHLASSLFSSAVCTPSSLLLRCDHFKEGTQRIIVGRPISSFFSHYFDSLSYLSSEVLASKPRCFQQSAIKSKELWAFVTIALLLL